MCRIDGGPGNWIVNWAPRINYSRETISSTGTLQDEQRGGGQRQSFAFAKNISASAGVNRDMERYRDDQLLENPLFTERPHRNHQPPHGD